MAKPTSPLDPTLEARVAAFVASPTRVRFPDYNPLWSALTDAVRRARTDREHYASVAARVQTLQRALNDRLADDQPRWECTVIPAPADGQPTIRARPVYKRPAAQPPT